MRDYPTAPLPRGGRRKLPRKLSGAFSTLSAAVPVVLLLGSVAAGASAQEEGELSGAKALALQEATALESEIRDMAMELWKFSETALHESRSAALLSSILEEEGFRVEREVAGMPTAFVAEWGSGRPIVGVLAEYDALPGIGNEPVPYREARKDGHADGQGCGHNLFGAASVASAIALKRVLEREKIPGTIRLYETPAEETVVGKVYMARDGVFDDLDAALEWHPGQETEVDNNPGLAMNNFQVEFFGQSAHGAADPWNGRSALDGVELMDDGVNLMREHIRPTTRIHYVIPNAGEAPNVVPAYAKAWYYVRDTARASVEFYYDWILDIAAGAAMGTRTKHKVHLITGVHAYNLNRPLQEAMYANLRYVGPPDFTQEDQNFARKLQAFLDVDTTGLSTTIKPLADHPLPPSGGSTDVAEVSWITPTAGLRVTTAAQHIPWHSWATAAEHGTPAGVRGAWVAAKVLAMTGADLFTNPDLLERAHDAFLEKTGGKPYESPIPADQPPPLPGR
ncbi:MAG: amidohydrolase [Gemmatimonadota bacterium]